MKEINQNLTAKQEKAIMALLVEPTIRQAAESSGVGETTLYRWLKEESFNTAFKEARKQALGQAVSRLQQATTQAVETLKEVMGNKEAPANSRVTASRTVLEMSLKAFELENIADKIEELERRQEQQGA